MFCFCEMSGEFRSDVSSPFVCTSSTTVGGTEAVSSCVSRLARLLAERCVGFLFHSKKKAFSGILSTLLVALHSGESSKRDPTGF